jgi:hypothetical protein
MALKGILNIMEDTNVLAEDSNTAEESTDLDTVEETVESTESTELEVDWKAKAEKAEADYQAQKVRAEKAEKAIKTRVEVKPQPKAEGPSLKDYVALKNADIHEDDVDDVIEYAKFKKISITDALKSSVVKATLSEKVELRNTANATNTGKTRSGSSKQSGENLLEKAKKTGEVPESDEAMNALLEARYKK